MARLPTTVDTWRLRASTVATADSLTGDGGADIGAELRMLRNKWSESVSSATEEDAFRLCEPIFFETWAAFSRLPKRHPLHLRQLYRADDLVELLRYFLRRCLSLERVCKGQGSGISGTGHRALGGPLGVGKTYLLRGLAFVVAVLCEHVLPVSHDYELNGLVTFYDCEDESQEALATMVPVSTLLHAASACVNGTITDAATYNAWLRANSAAAHGIAQRTVDDALAAVCDSSKPAGMVPMLLLDEVNLLYRLDRYAVRGKLIVREIQQLGRCPNVSVTASGSISNLRDQVFALNRWCNYPSLNSTLFHFEEVKPLRSAASMRDYLSATGMNAPTGLSADDMLSLTGGVARVIAAVCEQGIRAPVGRLHPISTVRKDPVFRLAMSVMLHAGGAPGDEYPRAMGMSESAMVDMLHRAGYTPECVASSLLQWRDGDLLLLRSSDDMLQLLYPYHARLLWAELNAGHLELATQARIQLHGVKGSIGNAVEALVRPHLDKLFIGGMQHHGNLVMIDKAAHYSRGGDDSSPLVPSACVGEIVGWKAQVGLEDVALFRDPDDATTVYVDGWQCKSPSVGTISKWGNFDAAVQSVVAAKAVHTLDPIAYASHAVVKALWGFCALIGILSAARGDGDSTTYVPRRLYLCTTAVLDADAASKLQKPFSFPDALVQAFGRSNKAKSLGLENFVLSGSSGWHLFVTAQGGLDWIRSVLPEPTHALFLTDVLDAREQKCREGVDGAA